MVKRLVSLYLEDEDIQTAKDMGLNISKEVRDFLADKVREHRSPQSMQQVLNLETGAYVDAPGAAEKIEAEKANEAKELRERVENVARSARDLWPNNWRDISAPAHLYLDNNAKELGMSTTALKRAMVKWIKEHPGSGRKRPGVQGKKGRSRTVRRPKRQHGVKGKRE